MADFMTEYNKFFNIKTPIFGMKIGEVLFYSAFTVIILKAARVL